MLGDSNHSIDELTTISHNCFFCGNAITFPIIMWGGIDDGETSEFVDAGKGPQKVYSGKEIFMHAECAKDLSIRLLRDYHEYDQNRKNKPIGGGKG